MELVKRKFRFSSDEVALSFWSQSASTALAVHENGGVYFSGSQSGRTVEIECFASVMPTIYGRAIRLKGKEVVPRAA